MKLQPFSFFFWESSVLNLKGLTISLYLGSCIRQLPQQISFNAFSAGFLSELTLPEWHTMLFHEKGRCLFYHMPAKAAFFTWGLRHTFSCTGLTLLLHIMVCRRSSNHSANYLRIKYSVVTYLSGTQLQDCVDLVTLSGSSYTLTCQRIALQKPAAEELQKLINGRR